MSIITVSVDGSSKSITIPIGEAYSRPTILGTTYYVSPTGSDMANGKSPATAWHTVAHVNQKVLLPGDGVLFQGGASFTGELTGSANGISGEPIIYGSYDNGNALLIGGIWIARHNFLFFDHLTALVGGRGSDVTVQNCDIGNTSHAGMNVPSGDRWHVLSNYIHDTGDSGMLTQSEEENNNRPGYGWVIEGNVIDKTGINTSITYGKHGIYLKCRNSVVRNNTITNFIDDGISQRYSWCDIKQNKISNGGIGVAYFEYDPTAGISNWIENEIENTDTGFYAPASNMGHENIENFVLSKNIIGPLRTINKDYININTRGTITEPDVNILR